MSKKRTFLICLTILIAGGVVTTIIFLTEPAAIRGGAVKETAMLVDVIKVHRGTFHPTIVATGTVQPSRDIILSPRVSGEVIDHAEEFTPGGFVRKGEVLLQVDPADYRNLLALPKSDLQQAISDLNLEKGRQDVAQKGYQLIDETLSQMNKALVLREPQLNAVKARVAAARAAVSQAELDLQRTNIKAPFDAHVLSRNVNIGSQVSPESNLGRLVGMEEYWVFVTVPVSKLPWISFPDDPDEKGSPVSIRDRKAWKKGQYRTGNVYRLIGALEDQTRLARILVSVPDPLAYRNDSLPRLMINAFVEANIRANEIADVIRLNRDYLRENETVWVMEAGRLRIRNVEIVFADAQYVYIREGLEENDRVVTTNLSTVADGAPLRTSEQDTTSGQHTRQDTTQQTEDMY